MVKRTKLKPSFRILLVDGEPQSFDRLREALPSEFEIILATDQAALKASLIGQHYDLVIIEPWLRVDGEAQFQTWLFDEKFSEPVIIFTFSREPINATLLKMIGADQRLLKSDVNYSRLENACRRVVQNYKNNEPGTVQPGHGLQEMTLEHLVRANPGATFLINKDGKILEATEVMAARFGKSLGEFVGANIFDFLAPELVEGRQRAIKQALETRKTVTITDLSLGRFLRSHLYPIDNENGEVDRIAIYVVDVTDQVKDTEAYQRRDTIMQAVNFAAEQFLQAASWRDRIQEVLKRWAEATATSRVFIYKYEFGSTGKLTLSLQYGWDFTSEVPSEIPEVYRKFSMEAVGLGVWEKTLLRGEIFQVKIPEPDQPLYDIFIQNKTKSLLLVPVMLDGKVWGQIDFVDADVVRDWSASEKDAVKTGAHILSAALRRERDELSRAALLDALPDLMFLYDRDGKHVDYHTQDFSLLAVPPEQFLGKLIEEVLPGDVAKVTRDALEQVILTGIPQHYEYFLPVGHSRDWEGRMVRSGEGGVAIIRDITERRRFEEELRQSEESVSALYEITASAEMSFDEKQQALLRMGCQRFAMDSGFILRLNDGSFEVAHIYSPNQIYERYADLPLDESFSREVIRSNQTLVLEDVVGTKWERHPAYRLHRLRSYIGAPLMVGGRLYGVLAFSSVQPHEKAFSPAEERFLHLMSQWIGLEQEREKHLNQLQGFTDQISSKNRELAIARDEALEVSRMKSEFLATMSHEIRTPMNAVMGMTELLLETTLDASQREYAETARDSARLLLSLLNNVLDFSKIEAGKLVLEQVVFDPRKILDDTVSMLGSQAMRKKIELNSFVSPQIPERLIGDPVRFSQVLLNLAANAVRFTNRGSVMVWSEVLAETPQSVELMIRVRDTGIGLPETMHQKIFQPFTQADGSTTRRYGGTGLGLTIARRLVEKMDGILGLESMEGVGSVFWFTAKFKRVEGNDAAVIEKPKFNLKPDERLLVFEGNEDARHIWQRYLEDWEIPFDLVLTPKDVIYHLTLAREGKCRYAGCILDYEGMRCEGGKACAHAINLIQAVHSQLILVTRLESRFRVPHNQQQDTFINRLVRPFSRTTVETLLVNVLQGTQASPAIVPEPGLSDHLPAVEDKPLTPKIIMVAEDNLANQHLATAQLNQLGYRVTTVSTGSGAVEELARHYQDYGVVLMDLQMPEMDGYEATRMIRKAEEFSGGHIPIVAMTASVMLEDQQQCLQAGMDTYISKPVMLADLRQLFVRIFSPQNLPRKANLAIMEVQPGDVLLDERVLADLRSLTRNGEPDFFGQLVTIYLDDSSILMQTIRSVARQEENTLLRKAIHSMKGISANLGAIQLVNLCGQVETSLRNGDAVQEGWLTILERLYSMTCEALKAETLKDLKKS